MRDPVLMLSKQYRKRAKQQGYKYDLSYSEFQALITSHCFYCGAEPQARTSTKFGKTTNYFATGVDRISADFGYTTQNCRPCCSVCNMMKSAWSHDEFVTHIKKILTHLGK